MSSRLETPPLAMMWQCTARFSLSSITRLGPFMVPSWWIVRADEVLHAQGLHLLGKGHIVHLALLQPALGGHFAVQGVDAHGNLLAMALDGLADKLRVAQGGRAQNHPADAPVQVVLHGVHVPDSAAHLHVEVRVLHHVKNQLLVLGLAVFGAVQVHHVEPAGPLLLKALGGGKGVLGHHLGGVVIPPEQPDAFPLVQINGWQ